MLKFQQTLTRYLDYKEKQITMFMEEGLLLRLKRELNPDNCTTMSFSA